MATEVGCKNAGTFYFVSQNADEEIQQAVFDMQMDLDWQGIVDFATEWDGWNMEKNTFNADDASISLDPWMIFALPNDDTIDSSVRGAALIMKIVSARGCLFRKQGGLVYMGKDGDILGTKQESLKDVGTLLDNSLEIKTLSDEDPTGWELGETSTGLIGMFYNGKCIFSLYADGKTWATQSPEAIGPPMNLSNGKLYTSSSSTAEAGEIKGLLFGSPNWTIEETLTGNLSWTNYENGPDGNTRLINLFDNGKSYGTLPQGIFKQENTDLDLWQFIEGYMDYAWAEFLKLSAESWEFLVDIAADSWEWLEGAADETWDWMEGAASDVWDWTVDAFDTIGDFFDGFMGDLDYALEEVTEAYNDALEGADDVADDVADGAEDAADDVADTAEDVANDAADAAGDAADEVSSWF